MARKDELTGRGPLSGNKRSHAMNHSKRKWNVNLQNVKIYDEKGNITSVKISTRTLKTLKKHNRVVTFNPVDQLKSKN
ncbi:MAG: 50S ribosomal protein L28 [Mycoplasmoidaceae bacterium]